MQNAISVLVRRSGADGLTALRLIPRQGWGGRGSLGYVHDLHCERVALTDAIHSCHLLPYVSP